MLNISVVKVFLASAKEATDEELDKVISFASDRMTALMNRKDIELKLIKAKDEYANSFAYCDGWPTWTSRVATGVDYLTRIPNYHAALLYNQTFGKATAEICIKMIEANKPVFFIDIESGELKKINMISENDPTDWLNGWSID